MLEASSIVDFDWLYEHLVMLGVSLHQSQIFRMNNTLLMGTG